MELFRTDHFVVVERPGEPFLRILRSNQPFGTLLDTERAYRQALVALEKLGTNRALLDLREGPPGRNDPEFEKVSEHWRLELGRLFEKCSVLVKSAAGKLQIKRHTRGAPQFLVTQSEAEAIGFLL